MGQEERGQAPGSPDAQDGLALFKRAAVGFSEFGLLAVGVPVMRPLLDDGLRWAGAESVNVPVDEPLAGESELRGRGGEGARGRISHQVNGDYVGRISALDVIADSYDWIVFVGVDGVDGARPLCAFRFVGGCDAGARRERVERLRGGVLPAESDLLQRRVGSVPREGERTFRHGEAVHESTR